MHARLLSFSRRPRRQLSAQTSSCINIRCCVQRRVFSNVGDGTAIDAPILILGGGPTGLMLANLLLRYQKPFVLIDAQTPEQRFHHPQAHFLNTRSMELFRHYLPEKTWTRIQQSMPPVHEYSDFVFGPDMHSKKRMAHVVHPLHRPLRSQVDANGTLVMEDKITSNEVDPPNSIELSPCTVGHLAQHTFCRILYDSAVNEMHGTNSRMDYGARAVKASYEVESSTWSIETNSGTVYRAATVVAADGANSWMRRQLGIRMQGSPVMQHLINVHFTLDSDEIEPAMLYSIFSAELLAMIVRHNARDYVMQIPYFPPYQTLEEDFTHSKVEKMLESAVGKDLISNVNIESIRPWTMGSLVAERYADLDRSLFLAGDAAHVFPPAGGFGMNTGIQDAQNLAWRLVLGDCDGYQSDRQPIARNNAALSVRNFQRVLGVTKACYLNDQHPALLIRTLNASGTFVPMAARRTIFQNLLRTAMSSLTKLSTDPNHAYARHITKNLRRVLASGQGLPLLFPDFEIGFSYNHNGEVDSAPIGWSADTIASTPKLDVGYLFPHFVAQVSDKDLQRFPNMRLMNGSQNTISTRDLPSQLATTDKPLCYVVFEITHDTGPPSSPLPLEDEGVPPGATVRRVRLLLTKTASQNNDFLHGAEPKPPPKKEREKSVEMASKNLPSYMTLTTPSDAFRAIEISNRNGKGLRGEDSRLLMHVLVRPDGHIANIKRQYGYE